MVSVNNELKALITEKYGGVPAFAKVAGLPPQTVYSVLKRGVEGATFETINKIYDTLDIDWAATGFDGPLVVKGEPRYEYAYINTSMGEGDIISKPLSKDEQRLLDCYRAADDRGRRLIMLVAEEEAH